MSTQQVKVQAPPGTNPGDSIEISAYGKRLQVKIPPGVQPGGFFVVPVPVDQPAAMDVPMAVPIDMSRGNDVSMSQPGASFIQQPYGAQPMVGQKQLVGGPDYVPPVQVDIGDGSLTSILRNCQAIRIEQQPHLVEVCGWESRNEYRVFACDPLNFKLKSTQLMHITETSECFERQCCGPYRSCELQIRRGQLRESPQIARIVKDFHLNLCFFFMRPRSVILDHNNTLLGSVYDPCACLVVNQQTYDSFGNKTYRVSGTICQIAVCCPCSDFTFEIFDASGRVCGKVIKVFNGCEELILNVNHFVIVFPPEATPEQKAALFCSAYLIDFQYFEVKNNNNNNNYN